MTGVDWGRLLDGLDEPPLGTVAEALADATDTPVSAAYDRVEGALKAGELVERDRGAAFAPSHSPKGGITTAEGTLDGDAYHRAYGRAREAYGAPLPRYLTNEDATAQEDVLLAAIRELGFFDLDPDAVQSTVSRARRGPLGEGEPPSGARPAMC